MTQTLKQGDRGALVSLLQLGLQRAGQTPGALDGIFGAQTAAAVRAFQAANALTPDGIAGARTHRALLPYYTGFVTRTIRAGDTFSALARQYGTSVDAIALANPYLDPERLPLGRALTIPLPFSVTPADIPYSSALIGYVVRGLAARYPMLAVGEFGRSVLGRPLWYLTLGSGPKLVFYNAAHHANEWITTPLLLTFCEQLCARLGDGGDMEGQNIRDLLSRVTLVLAPAVDPDGIDLVTGALDAETTAAAKALAENYPDIPFPSGWKANIRGIDLNLQYPPRARSNSPRATRAPARATMLARRRSSRPRAWRCTASPARSTRCSPCRTTRRAASSTGSMTATTYRAAKRSPGSLPP